MLLLRLRMFLRSSWCSSLIVTVHALPNYNTIWYILYIILHGRLIMHSLQNQKKGSKVDYFNFCLTLKATAKHVFVYKVRPTLTFTTTYIYTHLMMHIFSTSTLISIQHHIFFHIYHSLPCTLILKTKIHTTSIET
jgi:hypothetical protein